MNYTKQDIDKAYILGAFNVGGIEGLSKELKRLKELGINPHQIIDTLANVNKEQAIEEEYEEREYIITYVNKEGRYSTIRVLGTSPYDAKGNFESNFPQYTFCDCMLAEE